MNLNSTFVLSKDMRTQTMKMTISSKGPRIVVNTIRRASLKVKFRPKNENFAVLILKKHLVIIQFL